VRYDFISVKKHEKKVKKCTVKKLNFFLFLDLEDALLRVLDYESTQIYYFQIIFIIFMHC